MAIQSYTVIGGGLVGAASAYRLRRAGFEVTLIDPGMARRGASFGNIGHIATEQIAPLAAPQTLLSFSARLFAFGGPVDFRWRDAALLAPWIAHFVRACRRDAYEHGCAALSALMREPLQAWLRLSADVGHAEMIAPNGHAVVWMQADAARKRAAAWRATPIGAASFRDMEFEELQEYLAVLRAQPAGGVVFSGTGHLWSTQGVREAVIAAFAAAGGCIVQASALRVSVHAEGVVVTLDNGASVEAQGAVIAAGAWSKPLMAGFGVRAPLIGERGYSVQSAHHTWPESLPPTIFEERALVLTRFREGLRASSFVEFGDPSAPGDVRKWRAIEGSVRALGVAFDEAPDRWVGPRPTLPDYLPAIGRLEAQPRILYAFGHQHLGLTLAARTGELIAQLAAGIAPDVDLTPFRIERFAGAMQGATRRAGSVRS